MDFLSFRSKQKRQKGVNSANDILKPHSEFFLTFQPCNPTFHFDSVLAEMVDPFTSIRRLGVTNWYLFYFTSDRQLGSLSLYGLVTIGIGVLPASSSIAAISIFIISVRGTA